MSGGSLPTDSSHGDLECHLTGGKEPELVREVAQYWPEITRLTSTHRLDSRFWSPSP